MVNAHTQRWVTAAALLALGCSPMMGGMMEGSPADAGGFDARPPSPDGAPPVVDAEPEVDDEGQHPVLAGGDPALASRLAGNRAQ